MTIIIHPVIIHPSMIWLPLMFSVHGCSRDRSHPTRLSLLFAPVPAFISLYLDSSRNPAFFLRRRYFILPKRRSFTARSEVEYASQQANTTMLKTTLDNHEPALASPSAAPLDIYAAGGSKGAAQLRSMSSKQGTVPANREPALGLCCCFSGKSFLPFGSSKGKRRGVPLLRCRPSPADRLFCFP